jgi:hypothetical protein
MMSFCDEGAAQEHYTPCAKKPGFCQKPGFLTLPQSRLYVARSAKRRDRRSQITVHLEEHVEATEFQHLHHLGFRVQ